MQSEKQERVGYRNNHPMCWQPASGFTETPTEIIEWASCAVAIAKNVLSGTKITAHVWAYREQDCQFLAVDLIDDKGHCHGLNFTAGSGLCLHPQEPDVHDLTEALHMAGIVCASLGASVEIGCRDNEINEAVLSRPLRLGETNGKLALVSTVLPGKDQSKIQTEVQLELAGRMYECCDIERAIQAGQFKVLDDVLAHVTARSNSINDLLSSSPENLLG